MVLLRCNSAALFYVPNKHPFNSISFRNKWQQRPESKMKCVCVLLSLILMTLVHANCEITTNFYTNSFQGNGSCYKVLNEEFANYKTNLDAEEQCASLFWTMNGRKGGLAVLDGENEIEVVSTSTTLVNKLSGVPRALHGIIQWILKSNFTTTISYLVYVNFYSPLYLIAS